MKNKIGKITEKDLIKNAKKVAREVFGFVPSKLHKNKKKYSRKLKHRKLTDL